MLFINILRIHLTNLQKKTINFSLITESFIIPLTNNYKKFKKRIQKIINSNEIETFELFLNTTNYKNSKNLSVFIKNNFSKNFQKILISIFYIYGFFELENISVRYGFQILNDFFSDNYKCTLNTINEETISFNNRLSEKQKIKRIKDVPNKLNFLKREVPIIVIKTENLKFPKQTIFFFSEPFILKQLKDKIIVENCKNFEELLDFVSNLYDENLDVEKKFIKSYKGLISKEKSYLGRYSLAPYNPYDLLNSVWRFLNEKKGNE